MKSTDVLADFQFLGNRVNRLVLETRLNGEKDRANVTYDFDYKVSEIERKENNFWATMSFIVHVKAKTRNKIFFKIELEMEGLFAGDAEKISQEQFSDMLELNGLITLLHISRSYLLSITSQSGIQPPVRLPMVNVLKLRDKKARQTQE